MNISRNQLSLISCFWLVLISSALSAFSQKATLCADFERTINRVLNGEKIVRNEVNSYGCILEFEDRDLRVDLEVYESVAKAKTAVRSQIYVDRFMKTEDRTKRTEETVKDQGVWSEGLFFQSDGRSSGQIVLRHGRYLFNAISPDKILLFNVEDALRKWISRRESLL